MMCWSIMKTTSFLLALAVAVFAAAVPLCFSADQQYEDCGLPMRCGQLTDVNYPFWGVDKPNFCGLKGFQLFCKNDTYLTLELRNVSLRIMSFGWENHTITVAYESLFFRECQDLPQNFSGSNQLTLDPENESIDLFTCPSSLLTPEEPPSFTCDRSNMSSVTYYTSPSTDRFEKGELTGCTKVVQVPVLTSVFENFVDRNITLLDALGNGFRLNYTIGENESCRICVNSRGICSSLPGSESFWCLCPDRPHNSTCHDKLIAEKEAGANLGIKIIIGVGVTVVGIVIALVTIVLYLQKVKTCCVRDQNFEALVPLKRYSYAQVKKITKTFRHEVGKGGFGIVYRGNLSDGRKVAVKVLKESKASNGEDFINEVASMSRTSHVNIVSLLGFCYEGSKRAIIYEFLENGSLDKFISSKNSSDIDMSVLYGIVIGVARGLEYLHNGCRARIVHFDIKPQNILLDDNLCPKVSDFGLAKLCEKKESLLSLIDTRGTIGYIAPEVFSRMYGRVSHKSDVYSYGMLVLEIIGARNKTSFEDSASNASSVYFPEWIYKDLDKGDNIRLLENVISTEEEGIVRKMTLVGLWCIQTSPSNRPSMNRVLEMLEGNLDALEVPPRPVVQQISAAQLSESLGISEESSSASKV